MCDVFAFIFLYPSPFLSEEFHFNVSDLCREIGESLLMGYFFCSPHEQQHVKMKIKNKPKCLPGKQIRSCGNTAKTERDRETERESFSIITLNL